MGLLASAVLSPAEPLALDPCALLSIAASVPAGPAGLVSGDQRIQVAKTKAQQNHALLERELQRRKEQLRAPAVPPGVRIKEEPLSEEGEEEEEDEPMDTSPSGGLHSRLANGLPPGRAVGTDSFNGHPPPGCASTPVARELRAFVEATFQRQFVLTLSELKRLFNLHLASLPPGHTLFSGISDRMLQDTVLAAGCKQILVPTAASPDEQKVFALWESGDMSDQNSYDRC
ncbi:DNA-directed RNA polymerase III subunit RPC5 [Saguinus oedipus]|uniref:DNA-directed RNA polymerase III subunit RPC5 n=1 Tax=Saguinus oedipus TaxID=9490 RepID=A0ABQ9UMD1_SAGOE|nr:DNA-directed RNA polymerase III subunit RPC5 [Saguinus oedipus]